MTPCAAKPDTPQQMFVPLPHLRLFSSAEILLNNNGIDPIIAHPLWFVRGSVPIVGRTLTVPPQTMEFIDLKELLPEGIPASRIDGLRIEYRGKLLELGGQVVLRHQSRSGGDSLDVHFSMGPDFQSAKREAAWTGEAGDETTLAIANTGEAAAEVRLSSTDGPRKVTIEAQQARLVRLGDGGARSDASRGKRAMWAVIESDGLPADLRVTGFVTPVRGAAPRLIRFYDPSAVKQPHLFATRMRVRRAVGDMALKNTSSIPLVARTEFLDPDSGEALYELPPVTLEPNVARTFDLRSAMAALSKRVMADAVSVRVESSGDAGALIGSLYAYDARSGMSFDVPLRDSGAARSSTGSYPWRIDDDYQTRAAITNAGTAPAKFVARVSYENGGELIFEARELAPGASTTFDLRALRDRALQDEKGRTLPASATRGRFIWTVRDGGQWARLVGRAEVSSARHGVSSSYSCGQCCPDSWVVGDIAPFEQLAAIGSTADYSVVGYWQSCYGSQYQMSVWSQSWNVVVPSIASVFTPANGIGRMTGQSEGTTNLSGFWGVERWEAYLEDCIVDSWTYEQPARAKVQRPTYVRIIGNPQYTDSPPPPYVYNINREILDQDHQPINKVMFVTETHTPSVPKGDCTSLPVQTNNANSNSAGIFGPDLYSLDGGAPNPCTSTSTQSFTVRLNSVDYTITTKYTVTWRYTGVTVTEQ